MIPITEGNESRKYRLDMSQCISGNIMPLVAQVAILNLAEIHWSVLAYLENIDKSLENLGSGDLHSSQILTFIMPTFAWFRARL